MARKPNPKPVVSDVEEAPLKASPEVTPPAPQETPQGPSIEYLGEAAKQVQFTINPKARHYVVYPTGMVVEYL